MFKKSFIFLVSLFSIACQAQELSYILPTPGLESGFNSPINVAITPDGQYAYVTDSGSNSVIVIDVASNTILSTPYLTGVFSDPFGIAITTDGKYAYVTNVGNNTVSVIDIANKTIETLATGFYEPFAIAIKPDNSYAYVTNLSNDSVSVIQISNNAVTTPAGLSTGFNSPRAIAITPNNTYAYVTNSDGNSVSAITLSSNTIYATITGFYYPGAIAITQDSNYAYVANSDNNTVSVIQISDNTILPISGLDTEYVPQGITISGNYVYVTSGNAPYGAVNVILISDNKLLSVPGLLRGFDEPRGIAITPNGQYGYVVNYDSHSVTVIYNPTVLNVSGCKRKNIFLTQIDNYNHLTWAAPAAGEPAAYQIYRDAALTQLVATVPASGILQYDDHNRNPNINYTYYIVAVDGSGNVSAPAVTTVTQSC